MKLRVSWILNQEIALLLVMRLGFSLKEVSLLTQEEKHHRNMFSVKCGHMHNVPAHKGMYIYATTANKLKRLTTFPIVDYLY